MHVLTLHRLDLAPDVAIDDALTTLDPREALLTATDLAATRGDGIFETVVVVDGVPQALEAHLDRFARSAEMLELPAPRRELWGRAVHTAADALRAHAARGAVKFVMSRGDEAAGEAPTGWALGFAPDNRRGGATPEIDVVLLDRGYRHDVAQTSPWLLQGAKTLSYAVNMAALREARRRGASDVVFTTIDGYVLEGPNSTVIARLDGVYTTVPTELGVLPGTTQGDAFAALEAEGARVEVRAITVEELLRADALWLCSSTRGAAPVRSLDGAPRSVDAAVTERINRALDGRRA
ncbi:MAG: 4-amino-4-deoxychorismate lyase [Microbacterium sp. 14-71-5]|uniref:aminodeoxychorismate lyase n=1 Tax=Microbacterium sp. 13-71-7 TaxID=1970399 RepID=UPI000BCA7682|nr:aminodeoxychorismate lyase [Microbacterium sp. 13-71-7]OZB85352.1 MAG: 4-amino-4-deoxychorismate lyase [Microbacterium sp. 13-71-7]OZB87881.1 MAG: 4-amino-4-deoxychorismate lyase [Microbacterium sp. 14-71-5]